MLWVIANINLSTDLLQKKYPLNKDFCFDLFLKKG